MKIFFLIMFLVGFVWYLLIIFFRGNPKFWNKVRGNPDLAIKLFLEDDSWLVDPPENFQTNKQDLVGPFKVASPALNGRLVKIYGKVGHYEKSQEKIIKML